MPDGPREDPRAALQHGPVAEPASLDTTELRVRVKGELRRRMRQIRGALPEAPWSERSRAVCERALELEELRASRSLAAYVAVRREADPAALLAAVRAAGGRVALPRVVADEGRLAFHWVEDDGELLQGPLGTLEPPESAPACAPEDIDVVLVPALAVDLAGNRVGYGRGYYDRALPLFERARSIALVFDFQIIPEVPVTAGDVPLSIVVSDRRVLRPAAAPGAPDGGT